jgi:hypothetical protein
MSAIDAPDEVIEETEAETTAAPEDDHMLEHEPDDADVSDLVEHEIERPEER